MTESAKSPLWLQLMQDSETPHLRPTCWPLFSSHPKAATPQTPSPQSKTLARRLELQPVHGPNAFQEEKEALQ